MASTQSDQSCYETAAIFWGKWVDYCATHKDDPFDLDGAQRFFAGWAANADEIARLRLELKETRNSIGPLEQRVSRVEQIVERVKILAREIGLPDHPCILTLLGSIEHKVRSAQEQARLATTRNYSDPPVARRPDGFPRRNDLLMDTETEKAIRAAISAVEDAGAHPLLTDAVQLLCLAKDKVSDFVELP